ncbi:MAG: multidrug ABC transporter permease [Deltaproteobacteria bacterium]|nr:MAG: multidrug ABC transporter permease [Deltaproteobacteria bacterium]
MALVLLFTAIFATISIIEDRNEGFLQSVLAAPVPRSSIVLGKVAGTTALAVIQALAIFVLAPLVGIHLSMAAVLWSVPLLIAIGFGLSALGFVIAWQTDSTQGFHAIMTAFLMPMWFLSGAFFPSTGLPAYVAWIVAINPLTYGVAALRRVLYAARPEVVSGLPSMACCLAVVVAFGAVVFALSVRVASRQRGA